MEDAAQGDKKKAKPVGEGDQLAEADAGGLPLTEEVSEPTMQESQTTTTTVEDQVRFESETTPLKGNNSYEAFRMRNQSSPTARK